jgi:hypothetical protein
MIRLARAAILLGIVTSAHAAFALCPNCLAQRSVLTPTLELLGLFLLVPFAVAAIAIGVVRRVLYGRAARPAASLPSLLPPSAPPSGTGGDQGG